MVMGKAGRISLWPEIFDIMKYNGYEIVGFIRAWKLDL